MKLELGNKPLGAGARVYGPPVAFGRRCPQLERVEAEQLPIHRISGLFLSYKRGST